MNKKQRIVIIIGVFFVLLSGFFPAYECEVWLTSNATKIIYLGYHFYFDPDPGSSEKYTRSTNIIISRMIIQLAVISITTVALVVLFMSVQKK